MALVFRYTLLYCIIISINLVTLIATENEPTTVQTKVGEFIGYIYRIETLGKQIVSRRFLGIPYAEPPVESLRFVKPKKKAPLHEPYDATSFAPACSQQFFELMESRNEEVFKSLDMSDDCLYLNVYTPFGADSSSSLPVMIFVHGGAFVAGAPHMYSSDILSVYGNVVVVTIAYRLSVWGFLSTGDEHLPGNYGLFDQQVALQWVYDNIAAFGGDCEKIMVMGESAGGASTVYQSMYPGNTGIIRRAVPMSGSITCPWAFNADPLPSTRRLGRIVGCAAENTKELADCLRAVPTKTYAKVLLSDEYEFHRIPFEFIPVIDGDFLPESPFELINGNSETAHRYQNAIAAIDMMTGIVSTEGLMMITNVNRIKDTKGYTNSREEFEQKLVPDIKQVFFGDNAPDLLNELIIAEYTNWNDPDNNSNARDSFIKLSGDYIFNIQAVELARLHAKKGNKNTYMYVYDALLNQTILPIPDWSRGAGHGDDLLTMLGVDTKDGFVRWTTPFPYSHTNQATDVLTKAHITLWSNFAYSGNPNEPVNVKPFINTVWPTYDEKTQRYMTISFNMSSESVGGMLFAREYNFWRNILPGVLKAVQHEQNTYDRDYCEKDCVQTP